MKTLMNVGMRCGLYCSTSSKKKGGDPVQGKIGNSNSYQFCFF